MTDSHPYVTDHAFVRYIERVHGINVNAIKDEMLTGGVKEALLAGANRFTVEGITFKMLGGKITTIWAEGGWAERRMQQDLRKENNQ